MKYRESGKDEMMRADIIEAAGRVLRKWGMNKSTMEDIAAEAGKGKSTLYYYYKSKEELFDAVIMGEAEKILAKIGELAMKAPTARERIKIYLASSLTEIRKYANLYSVVRGELKGDKAFMERMKARFDATEGKLIEDILRRGVESGEIDTIKRDEIDTAGQAIVGLIRAMELYFFLESDDNAQVEMAVRLITNGL